ncbi:hypothetical protein JMJ35_004350 [Cladonia borealis]|uniref:CFEM domain-containing protein n=1 Tax=Cladonia borealis TaxID=184061 RepID=A0AA39R489_9LECA|nr:hypothetical protein JMJ35_004350 [Cladonia borealis]
MHHSFAVAIILAAPFVAAQSLSSIPSCALPAVEAGIQKTGCDLSNTTCICGATTLAETVQQQISTVCSAADQETTINTAQQYCSLAGVPLALPSSPSPSPSPSNLPVSPRDSINEVSLLPLASIPIASSSSSSIPSPMPKPSSSAPPTNPSLLSSTPSSTLATCPPPTTVTFYTTTTLSEFSVLDSASMSPSPIPSAASPSPLPVSTFPSLIPSAASPLLAAISPSLSAAASSTPSPSPSPLTLTSTILTVSSTSTLTLYSTVSTTPAPYALPNTTTSLSLSSSGMNTTNTTNTTTTMPFTGAAAKGGRMHVGWATFAVMGVGGVGVLFL